MLEITLDTFRFFAHLKRYRVMISLCFFVCTIAAFLYAFLVPEQFTSSAVFRSLKPENIKLGINSSAATNLNYLFTDPNSPERSNIYCFELLKSRRFAEDTINNFDLMKYFDIVEPDSLKAMDIALKNYSKKVIKVSYDEISELIRVSMTTQDKELSLNLVDYQLQLLDKYYNNEHIKKQREVRVFLEKRVEEVKEELHLADLAIKRFQSDNSAYQINQQIDTALDNYSQIILEKYKLELDYNLKSHVLGHDSPIVKQLALKDSLITEHIKEIESSNKENGLHKNLSKIPTYTYTYKKLIRNQKLQELMYEHLVPIYETARINELKSVHSMEIIDSPRLAGLRSKPKRALLIVFVSTMSLVLIIVYTSVLDSLRKHGVLNKN